MCKSLIAFTVLKSFTVKAFYSIHSKRHLFLHPSFHPLCAGTQRAAAFASILYSQHIYYVSFNLDWSTIYLKTQSHLEPFHVAFHIISHLYSLRSSDVTHKNIFIKLFLYEPVLRISTVYFIQRYIYISMRLMRTFNKGGVAIGQTNGEPVTASHYNLL